MPLFIIKNVGSQKKNLSPALNDDCATRLAKKASSRAKYNNYLTLATHFSTYGLYPLRQTAGTIMLKERFISLLVSISNFIWYSLEIGAMARGSSRCVIQKPAT